MRVTALNSEGLKCFRLFSDHGDGRFGLGLA